MDLLLVVVVVLGLYGLVGRLLSVVLWSCVDDELLVVVLDWVTVFPALEVVLGLVLVERWLYVVAGLW